MPTIRADATDDLFRAAQGGTVSEVRTALSAGANLGARDEAGRTPLHVAAANNPAPSVIMALTDAGADPRAHDEAGNTPLHLAAMKNGARVIVALTTVGADPGAGDGFSRTPLHAAAMENPDPAVIMALIEAGATPFDYARRHNKALRGTDAYWRLNEARFE